MARHPAIPLEIQTEVQKIVEDFNHKKFMEVSPILRKLIGGPTNYGYAARFKGKFLHLDRIERGKPSPICRLTWTGTIDKWEFAIYKYSDNCYDPEEWFFTGAEKVDGTITGAMEAGMAAYPI
jgi:hypothetical protein